jgi:hypothetical protein
MKRPNLAISWVIVEIARRQWLHVAVMTQGMVPMATA